jgi:Fur family transcriptional regulator, zinc uptake regulator
MARMSKASAPAAPASASACGCDHDPASWASRVERSCQHHGLQLTPLRRQVLDIFSDSVAPLGAYAILQELSRRESKQVGPPTVYRTLEFFLEHGFVHKIETLNAYAPCEHLGHAHQGMLLICEICGRSEEVEDPAALCAIGLAASGVGFELRRVTVEAQGLCRRCAVAAPD